MEAEGAGRSGFGPNDWQAAEERSCWSGARDRGQRESAAGAGGAAAAAWVLGGTRCRGIVPGKNS